MSPCNLSCLLLLCAVVGCKPSASDPVGDKAIKATPEFKQAAADTKARSTERLNWNRSIRVGAYEKIGRRNPNWDAHARLALELMSQGVANPASSGPEMVARIQEAVSAAMAAGCDDPLVGYTHTRFVLSAQDLPAQKLADAYLANYHALEATDYAEMVKFFCAFRTANAIRAALPARTIPPPIWQETMVSASRHLYSVAEDPKTPIEDMYASLNEFMAASENDVEDYKGVFPAFEVPLFKNWPNAAESYLLKGKFNVKFAWHGRGGGYANGITEERWKLFYDRSREAEKALLTAWKLNPGLVEIAEQMIRVTVALQKPRAEMELWFKRAMELQPNNLSACQSKLWYLSPAWYGNAEEVLKFGRECVASNTWKGAVPLALIDAHLELEKVLPDDAARKQYWRQPTVWPDVKAAYDRFFELNPTVTGPRSNFAWFAYRCEQWETFNRLVEQLHPVNYAVFGSREEFEKMVETGKRSAAGGK